MSQDLPFERVTLSPDWLQFLSAWAQGHHALSTQRALPSPILEQDRVRSWLSLVGSSQQPLRAQGAAGGAPDQTCCSAQKPLPARVSSGAENRFLTRHQVLGQEVPANVPLQAACRARGRK